MIRSGFTLILGGCLLASLTPVSAQVVVRFDIPFEFQLKDRVFPAGLYEISSLPGRGGAQLIRQVQDNDHRMDGRPANAILLGKSFDDGRAGKSAEIVFNRYDNGEHFFTQYCRPYTRSGLQVEMSEAEKALVISYSAQPRQITLLAVPSRPGGR